MKRLIIALLMVSLSGCYSARFVLKDIDYDTKAKSGIIRGYLGRRSLRSAESAHKQMEKFCFPDRPHIFKRDISDGYNNLFFTCGG